MGRRQLKNLPGIEIFDRHALRVEIGWERGYVANIGVVHQGAEGHRSTVQVVQDLEHVQLQTKSKQLKCRTPGCERSQVHGAGSSRSRTYPVTNQIYVIKDIITGKLKYIS